MKTVPYDLKEEKFRQKCDMLGNLTKNCRSKWIQTENRSLIREKQERYGEVIIPTALTAFSTREQQIIFE